MQADCDQLRSQIHARQQLLEQIEKQLQESHADQLRERLTLILNQLEQLPEIITH